MKEIREDEEKLKAYRKEKRQEKKKRRAGEMEEGEIEGDEEMMAMMGFSGFGKAAKRWTKASGLCLIMIVLENFSV